MLLLLGGIQGERHVRIVGCPIADKNHRTDDNGRACGHEARQGCGIKCRHTIGGISWFRCRTKSEVRKRQKVLAFGSLIPQGKWQQPLMPDGTNGTILLIYWASKDWKQYNCAGPRLTALFPLSPRSQNWALECNFAGKVIYRNRPCRVAFARSREAVTRPLQLSSCSLLLHRLITSPI